MRRAWHGDRLPDRARGPDVSRVGERAGAIGWFDRAAGAVADAWRQWWRRLCASGIEGGDHGALRRDADRVRLLPQAAARRAERHPVSEETRSDRRDRAAIRPRLCAVRLAEPRNLVLRR